MDSKQDYFRSPITKNFQYFCSPFRLLRHQADPFLINNSLSPFNRNTNSYISYPTPREATPNQVPSPQKKQKSDSLVNKISLVLPFHDSEEEQQNNQENLHQNQTPQKNVVNVAHVETTARKKYDLRVLDPTQKLHGCRDGERGLRALSKQAYEIFQNSQSMTYQQVAQKIIEQNEDLNQYPQKKKQRQSIKRRVYDALNVLIAVGILEKVGKKICLSKKRKQESEKIGDVLADLQVKKDNKLKVLQKKKQRIDRLRSQRESLKCIIERNANNTRMVEQRINFPFVIGQEPESKNKISKKQVKISGHICGDIDAIGKLNFCQRSI